MSTEAPAWTGVTVRTHGVNHYFGNGENRKQVLFNNNLNLKRGEIVIMTGPSGSGKTTLLTLIGGLRSVQEGSLRVMDRELAGLSAGRLVAVRRDIGFIFQAHNLFDSLTARQNVRMALELDSSLSSKEMDQLACDMLCRLGLRRRIDYKPQALSGGQRQRVAIARALVHRPMLVLADEPTAALDKESGREVIMLLQELASEEGCTILLVTHDNRILDAADRIVNMVDGHIASDAEVEQSLAVCESLVRCRAFAEKDAGVLTGIAQNVSRELVPDGKIIASQGKPAEKFYVIRTGQVTAVDLEAGPLSVVDSLGPGDFFDETALLTSEPHAKSYVAEGDVELYTLTKKSFDETVKTSSSFREQMMNALFQTRA